MGSLLSILRDTMVVSSSRVKMAKKLTHYLHLFWKILGVFFLLGATEIIPTGENFDPSNRCWFFESRVIIIGFVVFLFRSCKAFCFF